MASLTISPMSFKSPSIRVIGSRDIFLALDFFRGLNFFGSLVHLVWNEVVSRSAPPCNVSSSSSSGSEEYDF